MKSGTDRKTGKLISGVPYLKQRLGDVINTPLGSLVGRRDFGSRLHEMVDRNIDSTFYMDAYIRLAEAIANPENGLDDFKLSEMSFSSNESNQIELSLSGDWLHEDKPLKMEGIILNGGN